MTRSVLSAAALTGLVLCGACSLLREPYPKRHVDLYSYAVVTKGGLYDPGRLVSFTAVKTASPGNSRLAGDRFTDFLGVADFSFGYELEYNDEKSQFLEGVRVVATVEYNGTYYADTVSVIAPFFYYTGPHTTDTLRIALPAD